MWGYSRMWRSLTVLVMVLSASSPARADSTFMKTYNFVIDSIQKACSDKDDCLRLGASFAWFIWNNRDKREFPKNTIKCMGYQAYKRGYVMKPMKIWSEMNAAETMSFSIDVCNCIIGYWGKDPMCEIALEARDPMMLLNAIAD